mmetsp:Transcript_4157/g.12908  ORF Transcript_4157/g.12908 Transcript_4157/m.12908 type:complete len:338 (-) Transcript_4157:247-1260(-)
MALATGCSESSSTTATSASTACFDEEEDSDETTICCARKAAPSPSKKASTSATWGSPTVSVPVLSKTTAVTECAVSKAVPPDLNRMPRDAPTPVPHMTAVGVARPRAQGHATTSTETAKTNEKRKSLLGWSSTFAENQKNHRQKDNTDAKTTMRTKCLATTSAVASTFVFEPCARSTNLTTPASMVSSPTAVTEATNAAGPAFTVPATTSSPAFFATGVASPVTKDSSTRVAGDHATRRPSAGTRSPGRTLNRSPFRACAASMTVSVLVRRSSAVALDGCKLIKSLRALDVAPFARASRNLPTRTNATKSADVSNESSDDANCDVGANTWLKKTAAE